MFSKFARLALTATLIAAPVVSMAATAADDLAKKLSSYKAMSAEFVQYTANEGSNEPQRTSGHFVIAKPNLFRWVTEPPMAQTVVGDGKAIWIYDPDLEQVTRKPDSLQNGSSAPAMILNGQVDQLKERFDIKLLKSDDVMHVYKLTPKSGDSNFSEIQLQFIKDHVSRLLLKDSLGQRTLMQFNDVKVNPSIPDGTFSFTPPKGVDVMVEAGDN